MLLILANRNVARPAFLSAMAPTPWLWRITAAMVALLAAVMGLPWLRDLMRLAMPDAPGLASVALMLAVCVVWLELVRLTVGRYLLRAPQQVPRVP
jgi:Ca2+-transporting ATPase